MKTETERMNEILAEIDLNKSKENKALERRSEAKEEVKEHLRRLNELAFESEDGEITEEVDAHLKNIIKLQKEIECLLLEIGHAKKYRYIAEIRLLEL